MSEHREEGPVEGSRPARLIRVLALPIMLLWLAIAALTNIVSPQLEVVGAERSVAMNASDSPSIMAMRHIGQKFEEFDSDSAAMVVLEGDQPLGQDAHDFYDVLVKKLDADTQHVEHVQDFWETRSPRAVRRARTARPRSSRCIYEATRARRCQTSPSTASARSWRTPRRHRGSRPTSPALRP